MNTPEADEAMKDAVKEQIAEPTELMEKLTELEKLAQKEATFNTQGIGRVTGKDRKKSRTPKMTKRQKHRRDRAMRKASEKN
jgi:hypothetical protein